MSSLFKLLPLLVLFVQVFVVLRSILVDMTIVEVFGLGRVAELVDE